MPPDIFIPLAEQTGLIDRLTDLMIDRVVVDMADALTARRTLHVSINISAEDMESGRFLPVLAQALGRSGISASQIWLEATERSFMHADTARQTIESARAAGHRGGDRRFAHRLFQRYPRSSALPLDALKIDKIASSPRSRKDAATRRGDPHRRMAHGLSFLVIAEGVETPGQRPISARSASSSRRAGSSVAGRCPPTRFMRLSPPPQCGTDIARAQRRRLSTGGANS